MQEMGQDAPELATPYSFALVMERWALASFVDAIIFIDYISNGIKFESQCHRTPQAHLCDFLNVSHRLEAHLNLAKGGHATGVGGRGQRGRPCGCAESRPSKHRHGG
jgi:hypothetical protein